MALITKSDEVELNSIKYKILGQVKPVLSSNFAQKMVIGDFTKDSNPELSSWVTGDQRGGILVEEMDEQRDADRAWWSTCNLGFKGHILLPRLATAVTPQAPQQHVGFSAILDASTHWANDTNVDDDDTTTYATAVGNGYLQCDHGSAINIASIRWFVDSDTNAGVTYFDIDYSVNGSDWTVFLDNYIFTENMWQQHALSAVASARYVRIRAQQADAPTPFCLSELQLIENENGAAPTPVDYANFNSKLYLAAGASLQKLNAAGDGYVTVAVFDANITALIPSVGNLLYIFLGDSESYYWMDTSERCFQTDVANATYGIAWDSKLFKMDSAGSMSYTATPNTASPSWTDDGDLADEGLADNDVTSLFLYRSAAGDPIIYAGTKKGLYAHSFGNDKWVATELALPQHATAGKGTVHWRDKSYISAGLDVLAYQTGQAGTTIASAGLDRDDGLPQLRGGEIVKFVKGYNEFFALVDSVYEGATSRSGVYAYDDKGWQCWWEAGSNNLAMQTGIISSVVAHRLWFTAGTDTYYIAVQRNIRNPKKITSFPYKSAGVHITPWFDANWAGQKLALALRIFCKDTTANETVVVDYRIDHVETDLTTGWTNLGTIVAAGNEVETEYTFGTNAVGINFKAIQFRFSLDNTTSTLSPDVQYAVLEYQKIISPTWGYAFEIDCTDDYDNRTPDQLLDAVVTAAESEVLVPFVYTDSTIYVRVKEVQGQRLTGDGRKGTYKIMVVKPR